jgi:type I restriction enzyme R subunit
VLLVANKFQTGFDQPLLCGMYVDKRLAGIQAVQTLSRLNRAHPGKDTTYVVDFVNDPAEVLASFKTYYETAELSATTDPNLVFNLKAKLDAAGHYDEFEVDRVAFVHLDPNSKQRDLLKAVEPVVDRLVKRFRDVLAAEKVALVKGDEAAAKDAKAELDALVLFKSDMAAYVRLYTFLSQIFDYGTTGIEKRALFYRTILPLLEFGREREAIDLSKVRLSHYALKGHGVALMLLPEGQAPKLDPLTEAGSGSVHDKEKARLAAIIEKVNELFEGELTDQDRLVYVDSVIKMKLLESKTLIEQALSNTKEQFATSPDIDNELLEAIVAALDAHNTMSSQALNSDKVRAGLKDVLLNYAGLWEALRAKSA